MAAVVIAKRHRNGRQADQKTGDNGTESFVQMLPSPEDREMDAVMGALLLGYGDMLSEFFLNILTRPSDQSLADTTCGDHKGRFGLFS